MDTAKNQIASTIYHRWMSNMKYTLDLEELSYREKGREDPRYKTFKKHLMQNSYECMRELFEDLATMGIIQQTEYDEDVADGYKPTISGGSGYVNTPKLDTLLGKIE